MGNHPTAHQPLERATSQCGNGLRFSVRSNLVLRQRYTLADAPTCDAHLPIQYHQMKRTRCFPLHAFSTGLLGLWSCDPLRSALDLLLCLARESVTFDNAVEDFRNWSVQQYTWRECKECCFVIHILWRRDSSKMRFLTFASIVLNCSCLIIVILICTLLWSNKGCWPFFISSDNTYSTSRIE